MNTHRLTIGTKDGRTVSGTYDAFGAMYRLESAKLLESYAWHRLEQLDANGDPIPGQVFVSPGAPLEISDE